MCISSPACAAVSIAVLPLYLVIVSEGYIIHAPNGFIPCSIQRDRLCTFSQCTFYSLSGVSLLFLLFFFHSFFTHEIIEKVWRKGIKQLLTSIEFQRQRRNECFHFPNIRDVGSTFSLVHHILLSSHDLLFVVRRDECITNSRLHVIMVTHNHKYGLL